MKISQFLRHQDILLGVAARKKRSVLAEIAALLAQGIEKDKNEVLEALLYRERLGSTAMGGGIAMPHVCLDGISAPAATIATLRRPVWFDAPDDRPVDLLLALVWPKSDMAGFLPAFAHLCRLLRRKDLQDGLRASATPAEAMTWLEFVEEGYADRTSPAATKIEEAVRPRHSRQLQSPASGVSDWRSHCDSGDIGRGEPASVACDAAGADTRRGYSGLPRP